MFSFAQLDLVLQTGHNSTVEKVDIHPDDNYFLSLDQDGVIVVWDLNLQSQYTSFALSSDVNDVVFYNDSLIVIANGSTLEFWDFKLGEHTSSIAFEKSIKQLKVSEGALYVLSDQVLSYSSSDHKFIPISNTEGTLFFDVSENNKMLSCSNSSGVFVIDIQTGQKTYEIKSTSKVVGISEVENVLVTSNENAYITTYDLAKSELTKINLIVNQRKGQIYNAIDFKPGYAIVGDEKDVITVYDTKSGLISHQFKNEGNSISSLATDLQKEILIIGGEKGVLKLYNLSSEQELTSFKSISAKATAINFLDSSTVLLGYDDGSIKQWNLFTHEVSTTKIEKSLLDELRDVRYAIIDVDEKGGNLTKYYSRNFPVQKDVHKHYSFGLSEMEVNGKLKKTTLRAKFTGSLKEIKPSVYQIEGSDKQITLNNGAKIIEYQFNPSRSHILASVSDGFLYWIDASDGEILLRMFSPTENAFFYITNDNYYYASKSAMNYVGARFHKELIGFEQIDLVYNRPDKVLAKLPFFDAEYLTLLDQAYRKRLSKLNINEKDITNITSLPKLQTNLNSLPLKTKSTDINLEVKGVSSRQNVSIARLHILINGVPIFGIKGLALGTEEIWNDDIKLSNGVNKIQIYVEDEYRIKSLRQEKIIECETISTSDLYLLSIGSGHFSDTTFNLKYAEKDAQNIATLFAESDAFDVVHSSIILGKEVTTENVTTAIQNLSEAKINDKIMVFFAGHGVLDQELDYYLSSSNMNFMNPKDGGILFSTLEEQLSELPCRNKVLFVDACHSGEIDKEELALTNNDNSSEDGEIIMFRSGTNGVTQTGGTSVFELSKNIFVDLRENSGVLTISSAGGAEFAMEGSNWNNGVFTHCLLKGIETMEADLNHDKEIYSSELQQYLFEWVPKLTNGRQTPTSRVELLDQKIRLW